MNERLLAAGGSGGLIRWIVFFSPSVVKQIVPGLMQQRSAVRIAAIGSTTASSILALGAVVSATAETPTPQALAAAIIEADI